EVSDISGTDINNDEPTEVDICRESAIALVKSHDRNPATGEDCVSLEVGDVVTYTFTVTNAGNTTLEGVSLTDDLAGLSAIALVGGDTNGDGKLDLAETWVYRATYAVTQADINAGVVSNTATVRAQSPNGEVSDISGTDINNDEPTEVDICRESAIALVKSHDRNPATGEDCVSLEVGDVVTYTFTVTNAGNTTLEGVSLTDDLAGLSAIALVGGDTN